MSVALVVGGGTLSIESRRESRELVLVAERERDDAGPGVKLTLVVPVAEALALPGELERAIDEAAPNNMERARANYRAVFGETSCPEWVRDSIARYVDHGLPTGDFLRAVLANDLEGAFARADTETAKVMPSIVTWIVTRVPRNLFGNYAVVDTYVTSKAEERRQAAGGAADAEDDIAW